MSVNRVVKVKLLRSLYTLTFHVNSLHTSISGSMVALPTIFTTEVFMLEAVKA